MKFNWSSRRLRRILIAATCVLVLSFTLPLLLKWTSGSYRLAVTTAHQSPRFIELLGAPVQEAWYIDSHEVWGNPPTTEMLIPVRGQVRKGNLRARAFKVGEHWKLTMLKLELEQPSELIDLLSQ